MFAIKALVFIKHLHLSLTVWVRGRDKEEERGLKRGGKEKRGGGGA